MFVRHRLDRLAFFVLLASACDGLILEENEAPPDRRDAGSERDAGLAIRDAHVAASDAARPAPAAEPTPRQEDDAAVVTGSGAAAVVPPADGCPANAPRAVNRVRIHPASGRASELVGARIQGSMTSPTNDFVDLATIASAPAEGTFTELAVPNQRLFRYVKLYAERSRGGVAELELFHDQQRLTGAPFATVHEPAAGAELAFDGDPATAFQGSLATGNYVGLDLGRDAVVAAPTFTPPAGSFATAPQIALASGTPGARVRYTLDGSNPTSDIGEEYGAPFTPPQGRTTVRAIAYAPCLFESAAASATYDVGAAPSPASPVGRGLKSYHIGNSLTDTINDWLEPIADSTGVDHSYARWTIPGATVAWIWEHQGDGFGTPEGAQNLGSFARAFAPIDHVSVQPFSDPSLTAQAGAAIAMIDAIRADSPNVQPWIYAQWPGRDSWQSEDFLANGASWAMPPWTVARAPQNWEDATANHMLFHEAFRQYVDERVDGKDVLIVPGGAALLALKRALEAGQVAGLSDFFASHFDDDLHLNAKGQYLIALVFYACLYGQNPEGRVTSAGTGLSDEQARAYQRIAWETASAYPWSGIAR